ncbi:MAG TPA: 30S ribosome-binding factor RbfA [Terriglobales bacterium]|nr:30S ribosome-binding factor RbfA [Terriglobales bacterium]
MDRAQQHHRERLGEAIRAELTTIIEGELGDPRIGIVSVTEVHLNPDGKTVNAFVSVTGDEAQAERSFTGLMAAKGYIRRELAERLGLQRAPEVVFQVDRSQKYGARIDELLRRINKRPR